MRQDASNDGQQSTEDGRTLTANSTLGDAATATASAAISSVKNTVASPESESRRWRKTFDTHAKEVNGEK
jgi:solute carrier family 25 aspartate/glutamate transporter 12/13